MIPEVIKILDVRIVRVSRVGVTAADFVPANVINGFLGGAIFVDLPGKELIERVPAQAGACEQICANTPRFGKDLGLIRRGDRAGRLIAPIERSISHITFLPIRIRLLVALEMVPTDKNYATGSVQER